MNDKIPAYLYPEDEAFFTPETLPYYCNVNEQFLQGEIRALAIEFPGLGGGSCMGGDMGLGVWCTPLAETLGKKGILHAYLFPGPWSWMNKGAIRLANAVICALRKKYNLAENTPWLVMGGSMGGLGSLMFCARSSLTPNACIALCPCTDVSDCFAVHPEFPRTIVRAVLDCDMPIAQAIPRLSPTNSLDRLPKIPYHIMNDCADELFPERQIDDFVNALTARGHDVSYSKLIGCPHGAITPEEWQTIYAFIFKHLLGEEI
jgi:hypothetical protein